MILTSTRSLLANIWPMIIAYFHRIHCVFRRIYCNFYLISRLNSIPSCSIFYTELPFMNSPINLALLISHTGCFWETKIASVLQSKYRMMVLFMVGMLASNLQASYVVGGDLTTTWIGGNKYKIIFTQYKSCKSLSWSSNTSAPAYCYIGKNGDSSCGSVNLTLKLQYADSLALRCTKGGTSMCNVALEDLVAYVFTAEIDLDQNPFKSMLSSSSCKEISIYAYSSQTRWNSLTYCNSTDMVLTAKIMVSNLNSCSNTTNKGPVTLLPYSTSMQKYSTNSVALGIVDTADRDLLSFKIKPVNTLHSGNGSMKTCTATATSNPDIPLTPFCSPPSSNCAVNLKSYPSRGSWFDTTTGDYIVTPINDENSAYLVVINEYRRNKNGQWVLIAQHSREQLLATVDYSNKPPISPWNSAINLCVGDSLCSSFFEANEVASSADDSLIFHIPWTPNSVKPKATATNKLNVKYNVCFRPKMTDTTDAPLLMPVMVVDNNCTNLHRYSRTVVMRINPKPSANISVKYAGCNRIIVSATPKTGGSFTVNWQITQVGGNYLRATGKRTDTIVAQGNGTYLIRYLLSNGTGCFTSNTDTIRISDNPPTIKLSAKQMYGNGSDSFTCKVNPYTLKPYAITGKGPFKYQWYGTNFNQLIPGQSLTWTTNFSGFSKIGTDSLLNLKTNSDTAVFLLITDSNGCTASAFQRLAFINSDGILWKNKPLPSICHNQSELILIGATTKNLGSASVRGSIKTSHPQFLDSLGPDRFKFRTPPVPSSGNTLVSFYVNYDTLGCKSADTTSLTILAQPRFSLTSDTQFQCTQIAAVSLNKLITQPAKDIRNYTWNVLKWPARVSKPLIYDAGSGGKSDFQMQNNADSLPLGMYQIQACAQDTMKGCNWCDTSLLISTPINKVVGEAISICPTVPHFSLHSKLSFKQDTVPSGFYNFKLYSVNYDTNSIDFPKNIIQNMEFHPRFGQGLFLIRAFPMQKCWSNALIEITVLDTPSVSIKTDPSDSSLLPAATVNFQAITNANRIRWEFGTGNSADTSNVANLNWAYDKKPAVYPVTLKGWGNSGCYGEAKKNYVISQYNQIFGFQQNRYINETLQLIQPDLHFQQLILTDMSGKIILSSTTNSGISNHSIPPGIYHYRILYHTDNLHHKTNWFQGTWIALPK